MSHQLTKAIKACTTACDTCATECGSCFSHCHIPHYFMSNNQEQQGDGELMMILDALSATCVDFEGSTCMPHTGSVAVAPASAVVASMPPLPAACRLRRLAVIVMEVRVTRSHESSSKGVADGR